MGPPLNRTLWGSGEVLGGSHLGGGSLSSYLSLVRAKLTPQERGGGIPPPFGGGPGGWILPYARWRRSEIFFGQKFRSYLNFNVPFIQYMKTSRPLRDIHASTKKTRGSLVISTLFGGPDPKKKRVFLTTFRPLTPSRGRFEARNKIQIFFPDRFRAF